MSETQVLLYWISSYFENIEKSSVVGGGAEQIFRVPKRNEKRTQFVSYPVQT